MKGLDFSKFKKVSDEKDHALFKHDNGSELKIAKNGLSKKLRKQLEEIPIHAAEGADVAPDALKANDQFSQDQMQTGVPGVSINISAPNTPDYTQDPEYQNILNKYQKEVEPNSPNEAVYGNAEERAKNDYDSLKEFEKNPGSFSQFDRGRLQDIQGVASPQNMPSTPAGDVATTGNPLAAVSAPQDQGAGEMPIQSQVQQPVAPAISQSTQIQPKTPQEHAAITKQNLLQEDQHFQHDLDNGHIQPKTYKDLFAKKSTLGKIGTIFGLMLSGMGSGLSHQPDALLEMMNKEIKNDLDAQYKTQDNKLNWARLNQQSLMNQAQIKSLDSETKLRAYTMAQMQMNRAALHHLVTQTQQLPLGSPQRAHAEQTLAMLSQGVQSENFNLADRAAAASSYYNTMFGNQAGGDQDDQIAHRIQSLRVINPKMAESLEKRYVPGIGVSSVEVPDKVRGELAARQDLQNQVHNLRIWAQENAGTLNPAKIQEGRTLAKLVQDKVRSANGQGVFREAEANFINSIVDQDPTKFLNSFRTDPKYKALEDSNLSTMNTLKSNYGLPTNGQMPSQGLASNQTPVKGKDGRMYIRQGNYMVPVR